MLKNKLKTCAWLFGINLFISAFAFGGGFTVIPMIRKYFVQKKHIIDDDELMGMTAMAQSAPGAIAINLSTLAGFRVSGIAGAISSGIGAVTPPLVILSIVSIWYTTVQSNHTISIFFKGMQAGVAALIVEFVATAYKGIIKGKSIFFIIITPAVLIASFLFSINIVVIISICIFLSILRVFLNKRKIKND